MFDVPSGFGLSSTLTGPSWKLRERRLWQVMHMHCEVKGFLFVVLVTSGATMHMNATTFLPNIKPVANESWENLSKFNHVAS